jgi:hypothetical protein
MFPDWRLAVGMRLTLTPAQQQVAFEDQREDLGMARHLMGLRLERALVRRAILGLAREPAAVAVLTKQVAAETALLGQALAASPTWLDETDPSSGDAVVPALLAREQALVEDAKLVATLVGLSGAEWRGVALELAAVERDLAAALTLLAEDLAT